MFGRPMATSGFGAGGDRKNEHAILAAVPDQSLEQMTADFAAAAVEMAAAMELPLDYSEASLERVEQILDRLHREMRHPEVRDLDAPAPQPTSSQMDDLCRLWGSYFGEVVRRHWGGEWSLESYPGAAFATLVLNVGGNKLFPSLKIYRRLTAGPSDDLVAFYEQVRRKLSALPGRSIQ